MYPRQLHPNKPRYPKEGKVVLWENPLAEHKIWCQAQLSRGPQYLYMIGHARTVT